MLRRLLFLTSPRLPIIRNSSTVFALSTGLPESGTAIAVIRVTGPLTSKGLACLTRSHKKIVNNPRKAFLTSIRHPRSGDIIDHGMILWFPAPNSYTGEDVAEFHVHGSRAVVGAMLSALGSINDFRPAEEGEFTKRAFYNGKLTLAEVEALSSLISSQTEAQRNYALNALNNHVQGHYDDWAKKLSNCLAHVEAVLNFGEDEMIDEAVLDQSIREISVIHDEIKEFLDKGSQRKELIQNGLNITIIGPPNAGKSTLMNRICM